MLNFEMYQSGDKTSKKTNLQIKEKNLKKLFENLLTNIKNSAIIFDVAECAFSSAG